MNRKRAVWYGLVFGAVLFVFAVGSAGVGHGSYLPFLMFGAPLSLVPVLGLFVAPLLWAFVGWLIANEQRTRAIITLSTHTAAVALMLLWGSPEEPGSEQWQYFRQAERSIGSWLWTGIAVYAVGLIAAWALALRTSSTHGRA